MRFTTNRKIVNMATTSVWHLKDIEKNDSSLNIFRRFALILNDFSANSSEKSIDLVAIAPEVDGRIYDLQSNPIFNLFQTLWRNKQTTITDICFALADKFNEPHLNSYHFFSNFLDMILNFIAKLERHFDTFETLHLTAWKLASGVGFISKVFRSWIRIRSMREERRIIFEETKTFN